MYADLGESNPLLCTGGGALVDGSILVYEGNIGNNSCWKLMNAYDTINHDYPGQVNLSVPAVATYFGRSMLLTCYGDFDSTDSSGTLTWAIQIFNDQECTDSDYYSGLPPGQAQDACVSLDADMTMMLAGQYVIPHLMISCNTAFSSSPLFTVIAAVVAMGAFLKF